MWFADLSGRIVQLRVSSYLHVSGDMDYTPPLVEAVAQHLSEHPIATEYDLEAYWRAFQTTASNNL